MTHEEFTEELQKLCVENIAYAKEAIRNSEVVDLDKLLKLADIIRKWAMLWIDLEKRKKPKECEEHRWSYIRRKKTDPPTVERRGCSGCRAEEINFGEKWLRLDDNESNTSL